MEDAHACVLDLETEGKGATNGEHTGNERRISFFGVYDGHGGDKVAVYAGENLHHIIAKQEAFKSGDLDKAIKDGFLATDRAILNGARFPPEYSYFAPADKYIQTQNMKKRFRGAQLVSASSRVTRYTWYVGLLLIVWTRLTSKGNAGDSRAVLGIKGRAKPMSFDHKPQNDSTYKQVSLYE
jgi:protein phosphatase 2C family protein 2/3